MIMSKKNKPIGYTLGERKVGVGPNKGKVVIQATPSGRHRVSFDQVVEVMRKTGHDLPSLYRETSAGGLATEYSAKKPPRPW